MHRTHTKNFKFNQEGEQLNELQLINFQRFMQGEMNFNFIPVYANKPPERIRSGIWSPNEKKLFSTIIEVMGLEKFAERNKLDHQRYETISNYMPLRCQQKVIAHHKKKIETLLNQEKEERRIDQAFNMTEPRHRVQCQLSIPVNEAEVSRKKQIKQRRKVKKQGQMMRRFGATGEKTNLLQILRDAVIAAMEQDNEEFNGVEYCGETENNLSLFNNPSDHFTEE